MTLQIQKISPLIKPGGMAFISLPKGDCAGFEDPTGVNIHLSPSSGGERVFGMQKDRLCLSLCGQSLEFILSHQI